MNYYGKYKHLTLTRNDGQDDEGKYSFLANEEQWNQYCHTLDRVYAGVELTHLGNPPSYPCFVETTRTEALDKGILLKHQFLTMGLVSKMDEAITEAWKRGPWKSTSVKSHMDSCLVGVTPQDPNIALRWSPKTIYIQYIREQTKGPDFDPKDYPDYRWYVIPLEEYYAEIEQERLKK